MDSWEPSACYPRRTFDPLSTNPSTQCLWVTTANFRFCSTCRSHSQASLYCCALQLISDQLELTFARSRYSLGNVVNLIFFTNPRKPLGEAPLLPYGQPGAPVCDQVTLLECGRGVALAQSKLSLGPKDSRKSTSVFEE